MSEKTQEKTEKKFEVFNSSLNKDSIVRIFLEESFDSEKKNTAKKTFEEKYKQLDNNGIKTVFNDLFTLTKELKQNDRNKEFKVISNFILDFTYRLADGYYNNIDDLFEIVFKLNNFIDFTNKPSFTMNPESAIYGVKYEEKEGQGFYKTPPSKAEEIQKVINAMIKTDKFSLAGKWIYAAMTFSHNKLEEIWEKNLNETVNNTCLKTTQLIYSEITTNPEYKKALTVYLCDKDASVLIELIKNNNDIVEGNKKLSKETEASNIKVASLENENDILNKKIDSSEKEINELKEKIKSSDLLRSEARELEEKYKDALRRLDSQRRLNEDIEISKQQTKIDCELQIQKAQNSIDEISTECNKLEKDIEDLNRIKENLEADLENARNQITKGREKENLSSMKEREETTAEIVNTIKDYLDHFSKAFNAFKNNKAFDEMTLDICIGDLNNLIDSLKSFNVELVSQLGETVSFDIAKHYCEESVKSGENVKVVGYGWKLGNNIISKAEVEKI